MEEHVGSANESLSVDTMPSGGTPGPVELEPATRSSRVHGWLRESRFGLFSIALVVGVGAGFGAIAFRYLIFGITWLVTGHNQFGQNGYVGSVHFPWLGLGFFVVIPVVGGILYGPLIYRYAREARGHGVPEVMGAVAENGGRIRPQVSAIKAVASALCIGTGGSVGREGPIVQIGSALASGLGQWVRMPESRLRILVACGAGGGIAATFNAPITGVFFGVELILREFSIEAIFTVMLSAMVADSISQAFLGSASFFTGFPSGIAVHDPSDYLLIAGLAVMAALLGLAFKTVLYRIEDLCDTLWKGRPEWLRPAVGGIALGLLLLAIPQMYGVGYPVMYKAVGGHYVLWFLIVLAVAKMFACSLTIGIGGSGGVFAPSLFIGATSGMAFGVVANHLFGAGAGPPALYAVVAMGAVFTAAARAPLTSLASVVEMTGDFTLTLPIMLAVAISSALSRALSYGTIYTTKLLRRGTDIDRAGPWQAFQNLTMANAMSPFSNPLPTTPETTVPTGRLSSNGSSLGSAIDLREVPAVYANESLAEGLRQLVRYGRDGLPVLSADARSIQGWVTNQSVLEGLSRQVNVAEAETLRTEATASSESTGLEPGSDLPRDPLRDYRVAEIAVVPDSEAAGRRLGDVRWPTRCVPVSILRGRKLMMPEPELTLGAGDRVNVLVPVSLDLGHDPLGTGPVHAPGEPARGNEGRPSG